MYSTLKLLQPFILKGDLTLEEIAYEYQREKSPQLLATAYSKLVNLAIIIKQNYWGLNEDDVASLCLEKLEYCLRNYEGTARFSTYFSTIFKSCLRTATEALNAKKRKCILETIDSALGICTEDEYDLLDELLPNTLTPNEYLYCKYSAEGYSNSDIARIIGCSRMTISNIIKSLKIKLCDLQI